MLAREDFIRVGQFGIKTYPTAVLYYKGQYYDLRGRARTVEEIEKNFQSILSLE